MATPQINKETVGELYLSTSGPKTDQIKFKNYSELV